MDRKYEIRQRRLNFFNCRKLNGFSNLFWGWGGEDDDMSRRIHYNKLKITRSEI